MPKPIRRRVQKKAVTEKEILTTYERVKETLREKRKAISIGLILSVLVGLAVAGLLYYNQTLSREADELEYEGYKLYHGLYQKEATSEEEALKEALERFRRAYEKKPSPLRLLYMANTEYRLGMKAEALESLERFIEKYPDRKDLLPLVYYKISEIQIDEGRKEEALKTLETLYRLDSSPFLKDVALYESARILEGMNRKEEAMEKYRLLTKDYPLSPYSAAAFSRIEQEEKKGQEGEGNRETGASPQGNQR